ncbi:MAG TPA: serine/threonine protein phosphatase [Lentisphaeria bacterium]|nr:MAG: hypothetical protein A2X47_04515 [Lentisphaerae bacterium GWF2_38_69]HBM16254.1 serine/threonine protein phosphatase [Lentisphaeria bacterium]
MLFGIRRSFSLKLSLSIITIVVAIFLAVLIYNYSVSKALILQNNAENIKNLQSSTLNEIDNILLPIKKVSQDLGFVMNNFSQIDANELKELQLDVVRNNQEIYGCTIAFEPYKFDKNKYYFDPYVYKPGGVVTYSNDEESDEKYDYFKWDWYTLPKKLGKGVWSEPYYDEGGGDVWMVTYSEPFYRDVNGVKEFIGVVACDLELDWLQDLVGKIIIFKSGYAFLLSARETFIAHPNKEYFKKSVTFSELAKKYNDPDEMRIGKDMTAGKSGQIRYFSRTLKDKAIVFYQPLETTGWSLGIVIPENELYSKLDSITLELFVIGVIGYVIVLVMILIFSARATMPLKKLAKATNKIGQGDFNAEIPHLKSSDEIGVLSDSFIKMQGNLIKYIQNLKETTAAKEKIERDLAIGKEIQQSLLPRQFPDCKEFEIYAKLIPAKEVAGDLYDFFFISEDKLCFAIGDVSGKGVPAALFMAVAKTLLRAKIGMGLSVADAVRAINIELCRENDSVMFVTFFLCIFDIRTGELQYCNAGHNSPLIKKGNVFSYLKADTFYTALGIFDTSEYVKESIKLEKGDIFLLYTDGITEAMSRDSVEFSDDKLLDIVNSYRDIKIQDIAVKVLDSISVHAVGAEQSDDITLFILKYNG